jgi:phage/plasmid-associated DNA primase
VSEPDEGSELREGLIKSMTGGDPIPARGMYAKATVEIVPTWVAFMPTNHRPIVKGDDHAIWRRLMLVPFTRNFDRDPDIEGSRPRAAHRRRVGRRACVVRARRAGLSAARLEATEDGRCGARCVQGRHGFAR